MFSTVCSESQNVFVGITGISSSFALHSHEGTSEMLGVEALQLIGFRSFIIA